MNFFKKTPLPITGVMLGCAALGNLLQSYGEGFHVLFGTISVIIGILFIIKVILDFEGFKEDMRNPILASIAGTFSMALMLLAGYAKPLIGPCAIYIWYTAIMLHVILIIYFTAKFIVRLHMPKVFASYFIIYVGIVVASITAPAFESLVIGAGCFWFGFICLIALLVLVTYRYIKFREIPEPAQPLFCIYTAPVSLCVAGYIQSVTPKNKVFLLSMLLVATIIYLIVLFRIREFLKLKFYPSYAAFTFPFVISAIAVKQTMACMAKMGSPLPWLGPIVTIETGIATILVLYALFRFIKHLCFE